MVVRSVLLLLIMLAAPAAAADKVTREAFQSGGKTRLYFLYVPETLAPDTQAPLLVLLHGSGQDGRSLLDPWKALAKREGLILAAPNSTDKAEWHLKKDGPDFIADLIDVIRSSHPVDLRRLYLFGHSAGALQALLLGLLESEYFAAVGVHAGALSKDTWPMIDLAERKIPLGIWVGDADPLFPREAVRMTQAALEAKGLPVRVRTIDNHTHNYYQRSDGVNAEVWAFLKVHRLDHNPKFKEYDIKSVACGTDGQQEAISKLPGSRFVAPLARRVVRAAMPRAGQ